MKTAIAERQEKKTLDTKIFVFEPFLKCGAVYEMVRGGLKRDNIVAFSDYSEAIQAIRDFGGNIPTAVISPKIVAQRCEEIGDELFNRKKAAGAGGFRKASEKYRKRNLPLNRELLRRLRERNPDIKIYQVISSMEINILQELKELGVLKTGYANVDFLVPAWYGGKEDVAVFCRLGKQFQEKYFSKEEN